MEASPPAAPWTGDAERRAALEPIDLDEDDDRPPRRRRSALLGGGALVATSPVAVAAGLFVPGFAALGLGALLLLLPPRAQHRRRSPLRVVRKGAAAGWRGAARLARGTARGGACAFHAVRQAAANEGRAGVVWMGRALADGGVAVGRATADVGARALVVARGVALRARRVLVTATRVVSREGRAASVWAWERCRPFLRRAWAAWLDGSRHGAYEVGALSRRLPPWSR